MRRIAIVGGGPVGLYTAMNLSLKTKSKITIFEKRSTYTRDYILALTLSNFIKIDPNRELVMKASLCSNVQGNTPNITGIYCQSNLYDEYTNKQRLIDYFNRIDNNSIVAIKIKDVENHLLKLCTCDIRYEIPTIQTLSDYDIIIGADGANSTIRSDIMKSKLIHVTPPSYGLITTAKARFYDIHRYNVVQESQFKKRFFAVPDGTIYLASLMKPLEYIYHKNASTLNSFQDLVFGQTLFDMGLNTDLSYTTESIFPVISSVSEKFCSISENHPPIYLIGDALAVGNFFTGSGLNIGIDTADTLIDLLKFGSMIDEFTYVKYQMNHVKTLMNRALTATQ